VLVQPSSSVPVTEKSQPVIDTHEQSSTVSHKQSPSQSQSSTVTESVKVIEKSSNGDVDDKTQVKTFKVTHKATPKVVQLKNDTNDPATGKACRKPSHLQSRGSSRRSR
jgi:hypothetical protein